MKQFDSINILIDRSKMFEKYFGKMGEYRDGKIDFPNFKDKCSISYKSTNKLMSKNYYLSLQTEVFKDSIEHNKKSYCYLNRLGNWKVNGNNSSLKVLCNSLRDNNEIKQLLKKTDLDSITILSENGIMKLNVNLYGGGFSAIMFPPMKINIEIPKEQISPSARLLKSITNEIKKIA